MFGLNMNSCAVRGIESHGAALAFYEKCPTRRGMVHGDPRRIKGKEGSRAMDVRLERGAVRFRYHSTDVVVWHEDGRCTIDLTYDSQSTAAFARRFVPDSVDILGLCQQVSVGEWLYPGKGRVVLHPCGKVDCGDRVFTKTEIIRTGARKYLDAVGYREYLHWWKAINPLKPEAPYTYQPESRLVQLLQDPERYWDIYCSQVGQPDRLRTTLYALARYHGYSIHRIVTEVRLPADVNPALWEVRA